MRLLYLYITKSQQVLTLPDPIWEPATYFYPTSESQLGFHRRTNQFSLRSRFSHCQRKTREDWSLDFSSSIVSAKRRLRHSFMKKLWNASSVNRTLELSIRYWKRHRLRKSRVTTHTSNFYDFESAFPKCNFLFPWSYWEQWIDKISPFLEFCCRLFCLNVPMCCCFINSSKIYATA